ncbi:MAG TPA: two-component system response regulator [Nitrospiraceae bacterium]|nr:two-component system response regulator [Nitrospiraceae bacterium]
MSEPKSNRILLVEQDPNELELIVTALSEAGLANAIDVVRDGEAALDYLHKRGKYADRTGSYPVVILLALKLPRIDGHQILMQLKTTEKLKCIPVVVLTISKAERDIIAGYAYGANSYVVKPFDFHDFVDTMKNVGLYWTVTSEPPPVEQCKIS